MARLNSGTISRRTVEALPVGEHEAVFWDRELSGFGVRVYPSGSKVYLVQTRARGKSRRVTIGRHGLLTAEQARRKAAVLIADIKSGEEPVLAASPSANGPTLAEVGERYLREHVTVRCKPTTAGAYRHTLNRFLLPRSGPCLLGRSDATKWRPSTTVSTRRRRWRTRWWTPFRGSSSWRRPGAWRRREETRAGS